MTARSIQPRLCSDSECRGDHAPEERVALAASLCGERGVKLTDLRQLILEMLWESGRPMGAYDLMEELKRRQSRPIAPPTVYRTLQFLMSQGLVSKIESKNAYVPCAHPEHGHDCLFFICDTCGTSAEVEDARVAALLSEDAAAIGFQPTRRVIEVEGTCSNCSIAGTA